MRIECIGGPRDGVVLEGVPDSVRLFFIPLDNPAYVASHRIMTEVEGESARFRVGSYRAGITIDDRGDVWNFHYQGEE